MLSQLKAIHLKIAIAHPHHLHHHALLMAAPQVPQVPQDLVAIPDPQALPESVLPVRQALLALLVLLAILVHRVFKGLRAFKVILVLLVLVVLALVLLV